MKPTFQAACKSRATRLGVPPSPDELAAFDQSENLTSMHFKQLYSVLGLPLVQNKKKTYEHADDAAQNDNTEEISDTRGSYFASPFQSV